ncbi:unnamed protein product [Allacma fusca]|uniref:Uncharacterized protein n=1 Tax=Allacma fusca TaxID=39272 RepID=A0A8J2JZG9_9HEXA|nr:unnamed protein product [Allacma fusca]
MFLLRPRKAKLDNPIQSGFVCLDLAKVLFYQGYYQKLKKTFGDRINNLYSDTDCSVCIVKDPENTLWEDMVRTRDHFDFSRITPDHQIFQQFPNIPNLRMENAGKAGLWKVESLDITEAVTLKGKQYSLLYFDGEEDRKCKGLPKAQLKTFPHERYKSVILNKEQVSFKINAIRSFKHKVYNISVDRVCFNCLDIYRVYPDKNNINKSYPLGHYRLSLM